VLPICTAIVVDLFDEFILEFIWLVISIYACRKIPRFVQYSCVTVLRALFS